jgi:ornithine carbamoyltransferase
MTKSHSLHISVQMTMFHRLVRMLVINALSDKYHPLQTLADLMTLKEHFGHLKGLTLSWAGDGNNVLHDLAVGSLLCGMNVRIATPIGYAPDEDVMAVAVGLAKAHGSTLLQTHDPKVAVTGSDVVVTDTWVSMGQESDAAQKKVDFKGYQVDAALMALAQPHAVFLHCLPRKPEEVSDEVVRWQKFAVDYHQLIYLSSVSVGVLLLEVIGVLRGREPHVDTHGSDDEAAGHEMDPHSTGLDRSVLIHNKIRTRSQTC